MFHGDRVVVSLYITPTSNLSVSFGISCAILASCEQSDNEESVPAALDLSTRRTRQQDVRWPHSIQKCASCLLLDCVSDEGL